MNNRIAKQEVKLITYTPNPLDIVYKAYRTCYSALSATELSNKSYHQDQMIQFIDEKTLGCGHESGIEHFHLVFAISGVSRTLSHQHVRHRHASFSQKSQRYHEYHNPFPYVVPPKIDPDKEYFMDSINSLISYNQFMDLVQEFYSKLVKDGIPGEDSRYIFPNACETSYVFSCNFRELMHISNLRLCMKAQWEIRSLINKMCELVIKQEPWTERYLVPKCGKYLQCKENNSCGLVNKFLDRLEEDE